MPEQFRDKPFKPDRLRKPQGLNKVLEEGEEKNLAYQIARDHLDPLNDKILRVINVMVHENEEACSRFTRFSELLILQFLRADKKLVGKLSRHIIKTASYHF